MVFPGLMAMSVVRGIVGALELLQDLHLERVTREHLQNGLDITPGSSLLGLPFELLSPPRPPPHPFYSLSDWSKLIERQRSGVAGCNEQK